MTLASPIVGIFTRPPKYTLPFPPDAAVLESEQYVARSELIARELDRWIDSGHAVRNGAFKSGLASTDEFRSLLLASTAKSLCIGPCPASHYFQQSSTYSLLQYRDGRNAVAEVLMRRAGEEFRECVQALVRDHLDSIRGRTINPRLVRADVAATLNAVISFVIPQALTVRQGEVAMYVPPEIAPHLFRFSAYFMAQVHSVVTRIAGLSSESATWHEAEFGQLAVRAATKPFAQLRTEEVWLPTVLRSEEMHSGWIRRIGDATSEIFRSYAPESLAVLGRLYRSPLGL